MPKTLNNVSNETAKENVSDIEVGGVDVVSNHTCLSELSKDATILATDLLRTTNFGFRGRHRYQSNMEKL